MNDLTKTIMLAPETHERLKLLAKVRGQTMSNFFKMIVENYEAELIEKELSKCSQVVNVSEETQRKVKIKAVLAGVSMHRYSDGLIEAYCNADILA